MVWRIDDPQGYESAKIRWELPRYTRGVGLDIGCGPEKAFPHMIGIDNNADVGLFGAPPAAADLVVQDASKLEIIASDSMNFVYSSHLLEHIAEWRAALREWWRVIRVGGYLVLYLPHEDLYPKVGETGANPDHKWNVNEQKILDTMLAVGGWDCLRCERRNEEQEYSLFIVFKKLGEHRHVYSYRDSKRPAKTCAVVRYGAWGDTLQASSVFPLLKAQGYHITLFTTPRAFEVVAHDPNIDDFYIQDDGQVPNGTALQEFWKWQRRKFDKWVNLSESVEGSWLALHGRPNHGWPKAVRDKYLNTNYVQFQHELAEVVFKPGVKFYPSQEERGWAARERKTMGKGPIIMWVISGSSVHKIWPYMDQIVARILTTHPDAKIVFTGGKSEKFIEGPWRNEKRCFLRSGDWSIRETLAFALQCDMVIGPETGVLNAVSMEGMPKVCLLSHSSHENLTRDWVNTYAIFSRKTPCYPCHMLHYSFEFCHQGPETGTAQCQEDIPTDAVWAAVSNALLHQPMRRLEIVGG